MKTKHSLTRFVLALAQSKWLQPAALTLVLGIIMVGIIGCQTPHH